jgi:transposase
VRLRATPEQLCKALGACTELNAVYRRMLKMALEELRLIDEQIGKLDQEMASLLSQHQDAVQRLAEVPGLGVDSAQQIIAEVGPTPRPFVPRNVSPRDLLGLVVEPAKRLLSRDRDEKAAKS